MSFVANFMRFPAVQKFFKSVKIWQSYTEFKGGNFVETQCSFSLFATFLPKNIKLVEIWRSSDKNKSAWFLIETRCIGLKQTVTRDN